MADNSDLMERTMKRIDPPRKEGSTVSSRNRGETFSPARAIPSRASTRVDQSRFTDSHQRIIITSFHALKSFDGRKQPKNKRIGFGAIFNYVCPVIDRCSRSKESVSSLDAVATRELERVPSKISLFSLGRPISAYLSPFVFESICHEK